MEWFDWIGLIAGVVAALAALGALYFAWRTVSEARQAGVETRKDHAARRLEAIAELVAQIRLANQASNRVMSGTYQGRLEGPGRFT